jgi:hypothetical protein
LLTTKARAHLIRTVLPGIWIGNITMWDDVAIRELNPAMAAAGELPHKNITLAFDTFGVLGLTGVRLCKMTVRVRVRVRI